MNLDRLKQFHAKYKSDSIFYAEVIDNPEYDKRAILNSMVSNNLYFATYSIFVDANYDAARQYFYKCAIITEYLHKFLDQNIYTSTRNFCYAILSDNEEVIERQKKYSDDFLKNFGVYFGKAVQAVLRNDDNQLNQLIKLLEKEVNKKTWEKHFSGCINVFNGILTNNEALVEDGLDKLITSHSKQDNPPLIKEFFSIEATALAKLSWRRGIRVKINNTLVPVAIFLTKELSYYEGYEFFKELEK